MTVTTLPIIRQMYDADGDRQRATILLSVPDAVLMKYRPAFEGACMQAGFDLGLQFIEFRRASWHAVRGVNGLHIDPKFNQVRVTFAAFARGECSL